MTHEELIEVLEHTAQDGMADEPVLKALRAVVELHRPIEEEGKLWCKHEACYSHIEFLERTDCECEYPCPTIQAIEKELG